MCMSTVERVGQLIAGTTDFKVMIGMGEIAAKATGSKGAGELMQPLFRYL